LRIETSNVEESREFFGQEIKDGIASAEILSSRNESSGFIQHDRKLRSNLKMFAIDFDMVARAGLRAEVCANFAVDCDAARSDQLVAMPARAKTGSSKEAVQAHGATQLSFRAKSRAEG
jgi:hypothetical protein